MQMKQGATQIDPNFALCHRYAEAQLKKVRVS